VKIEMRGGVRKRLKEAGVLKNGVAKARVVFV
jgi:hypothetical protein